MGTLTLTSDTQELHEGDIGTEIFVTLLDGTTPVDLGSSVVTILLCGVGQVIERATELVGEAAAGTVKAVTQSGDLVEGPLTIRAKLVSTGGTWHTAGVQTLVWPVC